jgi:putative endonuclease
MKQHNYYVYITTNPSKDVLYIGVTNFFEQRLIEHYLNRGNTTTFAGKYYCYNLLYYERHTWINNAIAREKQLKRWSRKKKLRLIKIENPNLNFLNDVIMEWMPNENWISRLI